MRARHMELQRAPGPEDGNKGLGLLGTPRSQIWPPRHCTCQVEVGDGALGPHQGHCIRVQAAQVVVSPIGCTSRSSQIELVGQWGPCGHTVHLRKQKDESRDW